MKQAEVLDSWDDPQSGPKPEPCKFHVRFHPADNDYTIDEPSHIWEGLSLYYFDRADLLALRAAIDAVLGEGK